MKNLQHFKKTEIGLIPNDWELKKFSEIFSFLSTGTYSRAQIHEEGDVGYIHYGDIHTKLDFKVDTSKYVSGFVSEIEGKPYARIRQGDLIIADASEDVNGIGKSIEVINQPANKVISGLHTFLARDIRDTFALGFKGYIDSNILVKKQYIKLASGLKVYSLSKANFDKIWLPIPPLAEQRKIAQALTDADNYISALEKLIEKKKQLKEASLISIFDFNNAEWEVKPLSDLCTYLNDGTHYTPRYTQEGIPFYSVENVTNNEFTDVKYISKEEHETLIRRCKPENGDILMTRIGSVGVTKLIDWDINASIYVSLALLKFKNREFVKYFYAYSKTPKFLQDTLSRSLINATPQKINMNEIGDIPIYLPKCQNEQVRIANIILNLEKEIEVLKIKLSKAQALKQGMMQKLLTGEIRLA